MAILGKKNEVKAGRYSTEKKESESDIGRRNRFRKMIESKND